MSLKRFFNFFIFLPLCLCAFVPGPDFAQAQDNTPSPLFLFYSKDATLSTAFQSEFQKQGFRVVADSDLKKAKEHYASQLRDKGAQETVMGSLQEKYDDAELSKGALAESESKVLNSLAGALSADYTVSANHEFQDMGKDSGFYVVKLIVEELKVVDPKSADVLAVLTGNKTGMGSSMKTAKIKAARDTAAFLTTKIQEKINDMAKNGKSIHLLISNVLDSETSIRFSQIIREAAGKSPKRTYDSTQHTSVYAFPFSGEKDDFILKLMAGAKSINGIGALDIIDEQEGLSQITIKGVIKME